MTPKTGVNFEKSTSPKRPKNGHFWRFLSPFELSRNLCFRFSCHVYAHMLMACSVNKKFYCYTPTCITYFLFYSPGPTKMAPPTTPSLTAQILSHKLTHRSVRLKCLRRVLRTHCVKKEFNTTCFYDPDASLRHRHRTLTPYSGFFISTKPSWS